jgi:Uma2 family endonuclease
MRGNYQVRFCGGRGAAMLFSPTHHTALATVTLLSFNAGLYEEQVFQGTDRIMSALFLSLNITANQILSAGESA